MNSNLLWIGAYVSHTDNDSFDLNFSVWKYFVVSFEQEIYNIILKRVSINQWIVLSKKQLSLNMKYIPFPYCSPRVLECWNNNLHSKCYKTNIARWWVWRTLQHTKRVLMKRPQNKAGELLSIFKTNEIMMRLKKHCK